MTRKLLADELGSPVAQECHLHSPHGCRMSDTPKLCHLELKSLQHHLVLPTKHVRLRTEKLAHKLISFNIIPDHHLVIKHKNGDNFKFMQIIQQALVDH